VSKQFGVLSRFTAFLAVDRSQVVNKGGVLHQAVQPVELPAGWDASFAAPAGMAGGIAGMMPGMRSAMATGMVPGMPPVQAFAAPQMQPLAAAMPQRVSTVMGAPQSPNAPAPVASASRSRRSRDSDARVLAELGEPAVGPAAYLAQLATLARELETEAKSRCDLNALRRLRQRLTEWVEDMRSVGGNDDLAVAVEALVARIFTALGAPMNLGADLTQIADELAALAGGAPPEPANPTSPTKKKSRLAFWK
jgi:hypothetical protein